jgi:hypothetical protein
MPRTTALLLALATALPAASLADEPPERPVGAAALEGRPDPEPPAPVPCTCSEQCADRLGYGKVCVEGTCENYRDRWSLLDMIGLSDPPNPPPFRLLPAAFPAVGYNPALGALVGASGTLGMYLGDPRDTTISNLQGVVLITSNRQLIINLATTVMTSHNDWVLQLDWRFLVFNQDTWGLGTGPTSVSTGGGGLTAAIPGPQHMDFNLLRLNQTLYGKVWGSLYVGGGYRLDRYYGVQEEGLDLQAAPPVVTSNYAYSTFYGFNPHEYTNSGVALAVLWDDRDSTINPYRGFYAALELTGYPTWLGSSRGASVLQAEFRAYVGMNAAVPRNVLAFWAYFRGVTSGVLPYLALPSIGWDARNRIGRGYIQGRFRGPQQAYLEAEWRFRITNNGFLGGVLFANASSFSSPAVDASGAGWTYSYPGQRLLQYLQPAAGFGLRFMMNAESRTNVTLDFAFGNSYFGVWLNAGEYF